MPNLAMMTANNKQDYSAVYFKGGKSDQKYIEITRDNLFHRHRPRGKSFQTGIVPAATYSHFLARLSTNYSKIINTYHPINIKHFLMLCTKT